VVREILARHRGHIHGMIHCSGGGQTKILHFVDGLHVIKDHLFPTPPVFEMIREESNTPWREMYRVFNMGHRLEIYAAPRHADELIAVAESYGIEARVVGRVEKANKSRCTIDSPHGVFRY
jgi:phosphoribosylformylglycinamidine cyclo-ligase